MIDQAKRRFDAVIIGASLSGCAAAINLARKGLSVAIFDKSEFPRRKPCGEGLSYLAELYLHQLDIDICDLEKMGAPFYGYDLLAAGRSGGQVRQLQVASACRRGWGIERSSLDYAILERVKLYQNISVSLGNVVSSLKRLEYGWSIEVASELLFAPFLIVATGPRPGGLLTQFVEIGRTEGERIGVSFSGQLRSGELSKRITIISDKGGEVYITPLKNNFVNISMVGAKEWIGRYHDPDRLISFVNEHLPDVKIAMKERGLGAGYFNMSNQSRDPRLYLVGDASLSFDPLCGLGMTHAVATGVAAARSISAAALKEMTLEAAFANYLKVGKSIAKPIKRYSSAIRFFIAFARFSPNTFSKFLGRWSGEALKLVEKITGVSAISRQLN